MTVGPTIKVQPGHGGIVATPTRPGVIGMQIDLLYLDLEKCDRCRGTDRNLGLALDAVATELEARGIAVDVRKSHVTSAEQARELRMLSSPTLRVNGRDVALELHESSCGSESCTDGCGESINCRVWIHEGEEHTVPPVAMIAEAILREVSDVGARGTADGLEANSYELPENLARFFAGAEVARQHAADAPAQCCSTQEQRSCCKPVEKAACCGSATDGSCGCR
jgi:hypothetical protein